MLAISTCVYRRYKENPTSNIAKFSALTLLAVEVSTAVFMGLSFAQFFSKTVAYSCVGGVGGAFLVDSLLTATLFRNRKAAKSFEPLIERQVYTPCARDSHLERCDQKAKFIKQGWLQDPNKEYKRLKKAGIFTKSVKENIKNVLSAHEKYLDAEKKLMFKVMVGRSLEIRNHFKDTHYIFTHAETTRRFVITCLLKQLIKMSEEDVRQFKPFHLPIEDDKTFDTLWDSLINDEKFPNVDKTDHDYGAYLLSVDSFFWNTQDSESAFSFLFTNTNMTFTSDQVLRQQIKAILEKSQIDQHLHEEIITSLLKISRKITSKDTLSNFFIICIPKEEFNKDPAFYGYRAHPFGTICQHNSHVRDQVLLERVQGDTIDQDLLCGAGKQAFQYRLFIPSLQPQNGVSSFVISPLTKKERKKIKTKVQKVIQQTV